MHIRDCSLYPCLRGEGITSRDTAAHNTGKLVKGMGNYIGAPSEPEQAHDLPSTDELHIAPYERLGLEGLWKLRIRDYLNDKAVAGRGLAPCRDVSRRGEGTPPGQLQALRGSQLEELLLVALSPVLVARCSFDLSREIHSEALCRCYVVCLPSTSHGVAFCHSFARPYIEKTRRYFCTENTHSALTVHEVRDSGRLLRYDRPPPCEEGGYGALRVGVRDIVGVHRLR